MFVYYPSRCVIHCFKGFWKNTIKARHFSLFYLLVVCLIYLKVIGASIAIRHSFCLMLLCVSRFSTSWWHDAWWQWRHRRRNGSRRRGFLLNVISWIDRSWRPPSSYGRHEAPLLVFKHKTISQHTMQQVSIVKLEKTIIINVYKLV
jgi:hypothetical protein